MNESSLSGCEGQASASSSCAVEEDVKVAFGYKPLDQATDSFRLLEILPCRSSGGYLQLSLWHDVVSSASYHCLSYRWGDQTRRRIVLLNDRLFTVGENLYYFLEEMYARTQKPGVQSFKALWIDSISIDQKCLQERGHQVQHMGNIYESAIGVLVWLGEQSISDELHDWVHSSPEPADSSLWIECSEPLRDQWNRLRFNPYWYRAWIMQELLLARSVTIILSGKTVEWETFGQATARTLEDESLFDQDTALKLYSFWHDKKEHVSHADLKDLHVDKRWHNLFWELMHMHRRARCTDQRDRIYSLLGLLEKEHGFVVDYEESVADLFWRAGEHFNAWDSSELVDTLRVALLRSHDQGHLDDELEAGNSDKANPSTLIESLKTKADLQVRITIRRAWPTTSLITQFTRKFKCKFDECHNAPRIRCTRADIAICTNARAYSHTEHGCIHALAQPIDRPAAERFEVRLIAHHGATVATTMLPPTAIQVLDAGTNTWVGVSTWSSLRKALWARKDLDRTDRVKLLIPARYAVWIWFGVHPSHFDEANVGHKTDLPSVHHALPPGTKVTRNSIEVPPISGNEDSNSSMSKQGIFE